MTPQEASSRYHWCKYDPSTNTVELFLDHYMLSCLRTCEAKFYLEHLLHVKPKYDITQRKPWFLDFGEFVHWCLEQFYNQFKRQKIAPPIDWWLDQCKTKWIFMQMDGYKNSQNPSDVKKYEEVHGWEGVAGLLTQYYVYYMDMRLRVIDTEITFGHNREVYIGNFYTDFIEGIYDQNYRTNVKCYLTGRIDLLVDNGAKIGPVDHKTTHRFDGFEHRDFNPHDAMTGYIYAIHEILGNYADKDGNYNKGLPVCMGGWIFHISACTPSTPRDKTKPQGPRFKTTPVDKTLIQLEDFKARQLSTFKRVAELLFNDKTPEWNTTTCHNMFFRDCEYVPIHEQPSDQWPDIISRFYQISTPWDTRDHATGQKDNTQEKPVQSTTTKNA